MNFTQPNLSDHRFLFLVGDIYEDLELWYPLLRLQEAGADTLVAGPESDITYRGKNGYPCSSEAAYHGLSADNFSGIIIPGGFMPDKVRRDPVIKELVQQFAKQEKLIAAICHGGWIPISAGVYTGVRVTGSPGIQDDLVNAGAEFLDEPVVVDRHYVSSRRPSDLPDFMKGIFEVIGAA
ncbi:MAG: DJ-1/PfpI/YhbO family deglycase/protease [Verrucomicrobia bacterium]|jgi:protease I|nr:DJ-1/PfpI/YhbO family deglycase/protease [Verrucomicrobiota bacterium]